MNREKKKLNVLWTSVLRMVPLMLISMSCQNGSDKSVEENAWTENQEIHFYNDCKEKMLANGESDENAHNFCECCLLKLKDLYTIGREAMDNLTEAEIETIESDCSSQESSE